MLSVVSFFVELIFIEKKVPFEEIFQELLFRDSVIAILIYFHKNILNLVFLTTLKNFMELSLFQIPSAIAIKIFKRIDQVLLDKQLPSVIDSRSELW